MYNEFNKNITKESDPVRQKHYTTEKQAVGKKSCKIFVLAVWGKFRKNPDISRDEHGLFNGRKRRYEFY